MFISNKQEKHGNIDLQRATGYTRVSTNFIYKLKHEWVIKLPTSLKLVLFSLDAFLLLFQLLDLLEHGRLFQ